MSKKSLVKTLFEPSKKQRRYTAESNVSLACEKLSGASWRRGGKRKESLQLRLWNLNICIEKCEDDTRNDVITLGACRFNVCLHSRSFPRSASLSRRGGGGEGGTQGNWRRNSNSREVVASFPSFSHPYARAPRRACSQANVYPRSRHYSPKSKQSFVWVSILLVTFKIFYYAPLPFL